MQAYQSSMMHGKENVRMRFTSKIAALLGLLALPACASAAVIGGTYYAPQYDFAEFFAATDGRNFQVILVGNPFPGISSNKHTPELQPPIHPAYPLPLLTFTYDAPVESPRPYYRLLLLFVSPPNPVSFPCFI